MASSGDKLLSGVRRRLAAWYRRHARDLPWRGTADPYAVWISEIMLQQTQVATVGAYYRRWLERFPDVRSLAEAAEADVLKAWEGLGYYSRARNLLRAARQVVERFGGKLPREAADLRTLSGVGPYTAGAIASIAFGLDEPVLDGNVERVLSRVFAIEGDVRSTSGRRHLWELARRLIPRGRAGDFNQAMMDLGAVVCRPRRPACAVCPLSGLCLAAARGIQESLPRKPPRKKPPHYDELAAAIWKRGRLLVVRRQAEGLLGGLWELPGGRGREGESPAAALARLLEEQVGIEAAVGGELTVIRHAYTHFRITLHVLEATHVAGRPRAIRCTACRWASRSELAALAFGRAHRLALARVTAGASG
jgi:A/G-specific adenine glycosylase